jgi:hypothetical protein
MNGHWLRAIRYNIFFRSSKNISASIPARLSGESLLSFYCAIDFSEDFSERFVGTRNEAKEVLKKTPSGAEVPTLPQK